MVLYVFSVPVAVVRGQEQPWSAPSWTDTIANPIRGVVEGPASEGRGLYSKICSQCHGYQGKGDGPVAPLLKIRPANHSAAATQQQSDGALFWKIGEGRGQMASYKATLSPEQRWHLVNYIRSLRG